jgi:hypothetical protein
MLTVLPERRAIAQAFAAESERVTALARSCRVPSASVPGLTWDAGQLVAHLTAVYMVFGMALRGQHQDTELEGAVRAAGWDTGLSAAVAAANAYGIGLLRVDDPVVAADGLAEQAAALRAAIDAVDDLAAEVPAPWYGIGVRRTTGTLASLAVTESLVHGRDLALAVGGGARMSQCSAAAAAPTVMSAMLPLLLDERKAKGVDARFEVRVRGGEPFALHVAHGRAECFAAGEQGADCVLTLDPRAALLVGFGRRSLARVTLTGGALSAGRRPWLGLRFPGFFATP